MPAFSTIVQDPIIRALVQQNTLERAFHDSLYPRLMFRGEATPQAFPNNVGDSFTQTGVGLIAPNAAPLQPGQDPAPSAPQYEQWTAQMQEYAGTTDTNLPTNIAAIANLFYRNAQQLGMQAAQTINRIVRDRLYNAAESGWSVMSSGSTISSTTSFPVERLQGFTRARRPDLAAGSPVIFDYVTTNNPLAVTIFDNGVATANTVVGYTPTTPGDEVGPGTLTLGTAVTSVLSRGYIYSSDASFVVRVGGGNTVDALNSTDLFSLAAVRAAVARLRQENVGKMPDGRYHAHIDPTTEGEAFSDNEFQRLLTALPDHFMYQDFAVGQLLGCIFMEDTECPVAETVVGGSTATFNQSDPFAPELYVGGTTSGLPIHRAIFIGQEAIFEYYQDLATLVTEAGMMGKVAEPQITNNGIEIMSDRIQMILRAPLDRLQQTVSTSWRLIADWPLRTDCTTGDSARYKRVCSVLHV